MLKDGGFIAADFSALRATEPESTLGEERERSRERARKKQAFPLRKFSEFARSHSLDSRVETC